jgi:predicted exporter
VSGEIHSADLIAVARHVEGVTLVNQTEDLSQLLGRYRTSVSELLALTLVLLAVGLALRYRHHSWRMLLPLMLAMTVALGCAAMGGITLFHVMALLLVIGIGLDTAVFYTEGGFTPESWLASSLACGTSILAFGLLSLSAVPVLHQFGLIILVGILGCWLLTPLFFRPAPIAPAPHH